MDYLKLKYIPNSITFCRLLLAIPIFITLFYERYYLALYFVLLAGFSDGLDGLLARKFNWTSQFGAYLDAVADKLLMFVTYGLLSYHNIIPIWLFMIVFWRDVIIMIGVYIYNSLGGTKVNKARWLSKINTVFEILLLLFVMLHLTFLIINPLIITLLMYLVVVTCMLSLLDYAIVFFTTLSEVNKQYR